MSKERKYPEGLFFLVFTEFWERFGYYLMIGIFMLYMTKPTDEGGWGWDNATGADIFGTFIALVYLTPFMGGLLADLKLGYRFSITLGGILMGIGYILLGVHEKWAFYTALGVMIFGNGFFKPNISTLLGNLYNDPRFKAKKDLGYNIFYMGITPAHSSAISWRLICAINMVGKVHSQQLGLECLLGLSLFGWEINITSMWM